MSSESQPVVAGQGIVKTFKDFWGRDKVKALKGVDLEISRGSVFGLLGPNGAGKSTLIKLILGHLYPSSGRIAVFGKDPRDVNIKFQIGYLPERSYLYKNLTAEETLNYFGEILNLSREQIKSRTDQLLEMVGLQHSKKRFVGEFSHGMTRRMGLAQALLNDPDFIILDEPTAGLDPVGCREVKDLIITLGKRGKTVLLTSHLLADVEDTCDQVMMIFGGKVQSKGQLNDLLADTDRTKLEFPTLDEATLNQLKEIISKKVGSDINVSSPKQTLESYFLKVVHDGNSSQETAGAKEGTGVADYLKGSETDSANAEKPVKEKTAEVKPVPVPIQAEVDSENAPEENHGTVEAKAFVQVDQTPEKASIKEPEPEPEPEPVKEIKREETIIDSMKASSDDEEEVKVEVPEENEDDDELDEDLLDSLNL
ncbi:MAG: ABC transporter ATP-binding protein [Lentisphaeraceae bacterium]|nr:ABC transporter ATP-binding protein [Lentisphaeraceae bacterium]